jgi:hypothetical protein
MWAPDVASEKGRKAQAKMRAKDDTDKAHKV